MLSLAAYVRFGDIYQLTIWRSHGKNLKTHKQMGSYSNGYPLRRKVLSSTSLRIIILMHEMSSYVTIATWNKIRFPRAHLTNYYSSIWWNKILYDKKSLNPNLLRMEHLYRCRTPLHLTLAIHNLVILGSLSLPCIFYTVN